MNDFQVVVFFCFLFMASIITDGVSVMKQHSRVTLTVIECRVLKGHRLAGKDVAFAKIYTSNQLLIRVIDQSDCPFPSDSSFALALVQANPFAVFLALDVKRR